MKKIKLWIHDALNWAKKEAPGWINQAAMALIPILVKLGAKFLTDLL